MKDMINEPECKNCSYYEFVLEEYPSSKDPVFVHSYHKCSKSNKTDVSIGRLINDCNDQFKPIKMAVRSTPNSDNTRVYEYDIALSYAGEQNRYVEDLATKLRNMGVRVFYDKFEEDSLWGKELTEVFDEIFRKRSRYCVIFISKEYAKKLWPSHERKSALARAFEEQEEYILPVRFDDTEMPGIRPTTKYIDARKTSTNELARIIKKKLSSMP
jgi:hypothetical protein